MRAAIPGLLLLGLVACGSLGQAPPTATALPPPPTATPDVGIGMRNDLLRQIQQYEDWLNEPIGPQTTQPRSALRNIAPISYNQQVQAFLVEHPLLRDYEQFFTARRRVAHGGQDVPYTLAELRDPATIDRFVQTRYLP